MIKRKDLENYICDVNKRLIKIQFKLGHQYNYYTIELFSLSNDEIPVYKYKSIAFAGSKKECYNFLESFMSILFASKTEI